MLSCLLFEIGGSYVNTHTYRYIYIYKEFSAFKVHLFAADSFFRVKSNENVIVSLTRCHWQKAVGYRGGRQHPGKLHTDCSCCFCYSRDNFVTGPHSSLIEWCGKALQNTGMFPFLIPLITPQEVSQAFRNHSVFLHHKQFANR